MKRYEVTLISKDNQQFMCTVNSPDDENAVEKALDLIKDKGWECYNYKLKQLIRIK
jgi:hypothetical protein